MEILTPHPTILPTPLWRIWTEIQPNWSGKQIYDHPHEPNTRHVSDELCWATRTTHNSEDILTALHSGAPHKSPGIDGICLELYTANWETIHTDLQLLNYVFQNKHISPRQRHGIIICLPKNKDHTPDGYLPISILNSEYKLLARILARRLRHILADQFKDSQFCGVPSNSILDAISSVRDIRAHSQVTGAPLCIL